MNNKSGTAARPSRSYYSEFYAGFTSNYCPSFYGNGQVLVITVGIDEMSGLSYVYTPISVTVEPEARS